MLEAGESGHIEEAAEACVAQFAGTSPAVEAGAALAVAGVEAGVGGGGACGPEVGGELGQEAGAEDRADGGDAAQEFGLRPQDRIGPERGAQRRVEVGDLAGEAAEQRTQRRGDHGMGGGEAVLESLLLLDPFATQAALGLELLLGGTGRSPGTGLLGAAEVGDQCGVSSRSVLLRLRVAWA